MGGHLRSGTAAAFRKALPVCSNWLRLSDVTAATFHTTNQREGDARMVFPPHPEGAGYRFRSSQWAARRRGTRGSGGGNCRESRGGSRALHPWSQPRGRGERGLQSPLAVAPDPCRRGENDHGAWRGRGPQAPERAPQRSTDPPPLA